MDAKLQEAAQRFEQFKKAFDNKPCDVDKCASMLDDLKLRMTQFASLPPLGVTQSPTMQQELLLSREILEHGAFLSIRTHDIPAFERYVSQLKVFYNDFRCVTSPRQRSRTHRDCAWGAHAR